MSLLSTPIVVGYLALSSEVAGGFAAFVARIAYTY
jgi:hypothetical protein